MSADIFLGTQGWSYKSWVGNFYPDGTPPERYLSEYARQIRAVEIDSTYYRIPTPRMAAQWGEMTPDNFRFTAKFPQSITHEKMLKDVEAETQQFLEVMKLLGEKLGPLLLQFPYQFKPDQKETLEKFLAALPGDVRFAVEVRHRGWLNEAFFELLAKHRIALALTDYQYMPKLNRVTTDFTYIRWLGNRKDIPDDQYKRVRINRDRELDHWADVITDLVQKGITIWGFANNHYMGHSPATLGALDARLQGRGVQFESR